MPVTYPLRPEAISRLERASARLPRQLAGLDPADVEMFRVRLERHFGDLFGGLRDVYGGREDFDDVVVRIVEVMAGRYAERSVALRKHDLRRMAWPDWFQHETQIGYIAYADRFAGTLRGVVDHLDYLAELGVTYLHLMPFLRPREGENDGGYAVADYRSVDPRLGSIEDLEVLTTAMRERGISLCCDLVLNHVADDHAWAQAALRGEPGAREMFHVFEDRRQPDAFEQTLPEIFPATDPGNFTQVEGLGWVWTTFHRYQWDLNWTNPAVFIGLADVILELANRGIDVFRLDAIAFLWKRLGTHCQNQPEVHAITRALRAVVRTTAPAVIFKAEAIVGPDDLVHYLGTGKHHGLVSDIAYHNGLMAHYWSAMASRDGRLASLALERLPPKPGNTAWATYIRCHDDIGWAIADEDAAARGWSGPAHRAFLARFYAGETEGSHARGETFQENEETGDRRSSGSTASLSGLELATTTADTRLREFAIRRILLGHALVFGWGGVPLLYMGDELGLLNDYGHRDDPRRSHDNRWLHRPAMDWKAAQQRHDPTTVPGQLFGGIARLVAARQATPQLHARWPAHIVHTGHDALFAHLRLHPAGNLLALYNMADHEVVTEPGILGAVGAGRCIDRISGQTADAESALALEPYAVRWWTAAPGDAP